LKRSSLSVDSSATAGRKSTANSSTCRARRSGWKIEPWNSFIRAKYASLKAGTAKTRSKKRFCPDQGFWMLSCSR
jgi:hypothetical protein